MVGVDTGEDFSANIPLQAATRHARDLFGALGIPCDTPGTEDTPRRFVAALVELTKGLRVSPDRHFERTFAPETDNPGMILVPGIPFTSLCEHHVLPFTGVAVIGYIPKPGGHVLGLSKFARVVQEYAARPQMQERLGELVVDAIARNLEVRGAACVIRSEHTCMTLRGVRAAGASMVTSHLAGEFRDDAAMRAEFLHLARA